MASGSSGSAKNEVRDLERFQRKSAAIETIFTLAVLYVGALQVVPIGDAWDIALIPVAFLTAGALLLGGRNLVEQLALPQLIPDRFTADA